MRVTRNENFVPWSLLTLKIVLLNTKIVVETVRTVKNILDYWRIESIILFLYVDLEKPMIASIAHVRDVIGMLWVTAD
jgi:hypothetical protein